jgi:hypothetical protein
MNCCNNNGQCTQGANCPVRKPAPSYTPNSDYIGREDNDSPPMGYSHDFLSMLAIWVVGLILGIVGTILVLLG